MRQKSGPAKEPAEQVIKTIRRATRRQFSAEEKIRIVLEGFVTLLKIERGFFGLHSYNHAAATTSRQVCMAEALKARCVLAEMRWRWT